MEQQVLETFGSLEFDHQNLLNSEENCVDKYQIFDTSMYEEDEFDFNSGSCQNEIRINSSIGNSSGSRILFDKSIDESKKEGFDADQESVQVSLLESYDKFSKRKEVIAHVCQMKK